MRAGKTLDGVAAVTTQRRRETNRRPVPPRARPRVEQLEPRNLLTTFQHLDPGFPITLNETVPVNIVFVGYTEQQVNAPIFLAALPSAYDPVVRSRLYYGVQEPVGLHFRFRYNVTFTGDAWEDRFFGTLRGLGVPGAPTLAQELYNFQVANVRDVGVNYQINAPAVEQWLAANAPAGVDTTRNTIFFINWANRPDFVFHSYAKPGEADPDTGVDFAAYPDRDLIAWGGTTADDEETGLGPAGTHRIWFHDLSAGPDFRSGGWNVDDADLDFDGLADYRLPPVWEYATNGYRPPSALTGDLARVARFVGIDLLFTPSAAYAPYLTGDRQPDRIDIDVNTFEGLPGFNASEVAFDGDYVRGEMRELIPVPLSLDEQDLAYTGRSRQSYEEWLKAYFGLPAEPTYTELGNTSPFANLFYDGAAHLGDYLDDTGIVRDQYTYEAVVINYATPDAFFLGLADDNSSDGTQSFTYGFVSPGILDFGYGLTTTTIHELGHHFGLSHPHDGYDPTVETGFLPPGEFAPTGPYYFTWVGDQVNSMMSYIDLNWDFSQFDRDTMNRYLAAGYVRSANNIAEDVLAAGPSSLSALYHLSLADYAVGLAKAALEVHEYVWARQFARWAYDQALLAAKEVGVEVVPDDSGRTLSPGAGGPGRPFAGGCGCSLCRGAAALRGSFATAASLTLEGRDQPATAGAPVELPFLGVALTEPLRDNTTTPLPAWQDGDEFAVSSPDVPDDAPRASAGDTTAAPLRRVAKVAATGRGHGPLGLAYLDHLSG